MMLSMILHFSSAATMPPKFQTERCYGNTLLQLLFYNHTLRQLAPNYDYECAAM